MYSQSKKLIILSYVISLVLTIFNVSISQPFLLSTAQTKITTVNTDFASAFLVGFEDSRARRYSGDFSSYVQLSVPQPVDDFSSSVINRTISLLNGTAWNMIENMTVALCNNYSHLYSFAYPSFNPIDAYNFTQPIIKYYGVPLYTPPNRTPAHVLIFSQSIKVAFKGTVTTVFNLTEAYGANAYCTGVINRNLFYRGSGDDLRVLYTQYQAVAGVGLVSITVILDFHYNYSSLSFDLYAHSNFYTLKSFTHIVTNMVTANRLVLMLVEGGPFLLYDYGNTLSPLYTISPSFANQNITLFYQGSNYYLLYSQGLALMNITPQTTDYYGSSMISSLPSSIYQYRLNTPQTTDYYDSTLVSSLPSNNYYRLNTQINVLYIPNEPYIYKGNCFGQYQEINDGSCVSYSCTVANCIQCIFSPNACSVCASGYVRNDNLTCTLSADIILSEFSWILDEIWIQDSVLLTKNTTKIMISLPSMRSLSPFFYYFGSFDDLYLYMYHDRVYGPIMSQLFSQIDAIQSQKWSMLNYASELSLFGVNNRTFYEQINYQDEYLTYRYKNEGRESEGSEGLLVNCVNFFILEIPLVFLGFLLLRRVFYLLYRYHLSILLRLFDFWGYFFIILFEGNIQQFTFYLFSEWQNIFAFTFSDWLVKAFVILFGFLLVLVACSWSLVTLGLYRKLNKYLLDNNHNSLRGTAFFLLQFGLRNFLLGAMHSILRHLSHDKMMGVLIGTEVVFLVLFTLSIPWRVYKSMVNIWIYLLLTFIRIVLLFTLCLDYGNNSYLIELAQCAIIILMTLIYFIGTIKSTFQTFWELIKNIWSAIKEMLFVRNKQKDDALKM